MYMQWIECEGGCISQCVRRTHNAPLACYRHNSTPPALPTVKVTGRMQRVGLPIVCNLCERCSLSLIATSHIGELRPLKMMKRSTTGDDGDMRQECGSFIFVWRRVKKYGKEFSTVMSTVFNLK